MKLWFVLRTSLFGGDYLRREFKQSGRNFSR